MNKTLLLQTALCAALLAPVVPITPMAGAQGASGTTLAANARVIVKYKAAAGLLRKRALSAHDQHALQAQTLGQRHGILLRTGAGLHERAQVVFASGMSSQQLASKLAQDSEVEYAVPDARKRRSAAPNDSFYTTVPNADGPATGQWYLRANDGEVKSSIDVEPAWAITTGSSSIVVAVLDTGVRFDHPDLKRVANGGNLLPGYDMISDLDVANDSDGRDADPSDPGDWLTLAEVTTPGGPFDQCGARAEDSSWHGTQTAGLIGALTNNGIGMASVGRTVRVLPVRVLGKCGGFDSDIIAGMRWAAGLSIDDPAVPSNPLANRARVINLSLGGEGACTQAYQDTVNELNAAGVTIVASAGNSVGHAVSSPANCSGVIAVAGLRHAGSKVGFSDLGPQIGISAPGGNCINIDGVLPCLYPILTTSNSGLTIPVSNAGGGSIYTDSFNASVGTSFSAPLVAGTAALVLSTQPLLTPSEVRAILRSTARDFPRTGADNGTDPTPVTECFAPNPIGQHQVDQQQCYCTTSLCGAGMLDAGAAVQLAAVGVVPRITLTPANPLAGQTLTLGGNTSLVGSGRSIAAYQWAIAPGGIVTAFTGRSDAATASVTPSAAGQFSVSLTLTDDHGAQATSTSEIVVSAAPSTGGGGALGATWLLLLWCAVAALARRRT
ncbi:MAG: S8 family serine peptidase [Burkholderiales bacterium]|nr:S8 family serine peptidase [Burkholderiales bacterium]